jgi:aminopeptidase N
MNFAGNRSMPSRSRLALILLAAGSLCSAIAMPTRADEPEPRERRAFDPTTGRNLLNFPPHRSADIRHMRLQLRIPNMNERSMLATETITVAPISLDLSTLTLHAAQLQVASVTCPNRTCTFARNDEDETLTVGLTPPLAKGEVAEITINYRISDPPEGLMWTVESPAFPGRAAQISSQGESESNRYWFAGHDFPNARATSELIVTVPRGFQVVSNGRLESVTREKLEPFDTFHWVQDKPISSYLVDLVVGKWDVVDVGTSKLPMPVYVAPGQGDRVRPVFGRTPKMVELLARLSGEPYPWSKYAQVSVNNFAWGGMENGSATTLYETVALNKTALLDGDQDELLVHELAHQWFGDLVTCNSWEHIWLNEGFATYCEALWQQYKDSSVPSSGHGSEGLRANNDAYQAAIWAWQQDVIKDDTGAAPYQPAMASKEYDSPDDVFDRAANPYPKGAMILHMLRERMGDEVFFRGLAEYVKKYKFKQVETFQFRECMERASGLSLQRFFDQWAFRPLTPNVRVTPAWDAVAGTLNVAFDQLQTIDGYNPAFDLAIPVWIRSKGQSNWTKLEARFDVRQYTLSNKLAAEPDMIVVDPELTMLADIDVAATPSEWARQLASGPTMGARLRAAKALGRPGATEQDAAALAAVVRDDRTLRNLRLAAAKSLGNVGTNASASLRAFLGSSLADAPVRSAIIEQAARVAASGDAASKTDVAAQLVHAFNSDPSYGVRAAAVRGLGTLKAESGWPTILAALDVDSQHDQIRKAAVAALADMDRADGLPLVLRRVAYGNSSDLRPEAATALARLAHHDPDRVFNVLAALLEDREPKTVQSAGKALADIGGSRVRSLFQQRLSALTSQYLKGRTRAWLRDMKDDKAQTARP